MPQIAIEDPALDLSIEVIESSLRAHNDAFRADEPRRVFNVMLRDDADTIVGGCVCILRWHWLHVELLWIAEAFRHRGFGRALMRAAEEWARARGCTKSRLDTASFQAQPFYESIGYRVFGTIHDYPPGHSVIYLQKDLTPSSDD